jgi:carbonic anhydrase
MCENCLWQHPNRRGFLKTAAAAAFTTMAAAPILAHAAAADAPNAIPPKEALKRLVAGNAHYAAGGARCVDVSRGRAERVAVQYPIAAIVSCSDSRVVPELAFDQGPGDLFLVRVAGNFVNDDGLASLEYAVAMLGAPLIVVLGHQNCGAVAAAIKVVKDNATLPGHLPGLIDAIKPAVIKAEAGHPKDLLAAAIEENVRRNVVRLTAAKPILAEKVAAGKLMVAGGVYDLASGKINFV